MDTTVKTYQKTALYTPAVSVKSFKTFAFWEAVESSRFGIIPLLVVFTTALGGLSIAFGADSDIIKLSLVTFPSVIALSMVLAVAPMRLIIWTSSIAVLLDLVVFFL